MESFDKGDAVLILGIHEVFDPVNEIWGISNADDIRLTVTDPVGVVKVNSVQMANIALGKYQYIYQIPFDAQSGIWQCKIIVTNGSNSTVEPFEFKVVES